MTFGSWIRRLGHNQQDNTGGLDRKEIEELVANAGRVPRSVASSPAKTASVKRIRTVSGPTTIAEKYGRPAPRHVVVNKRQVMVRPTVPSDTAEPKLMEVPRAPKSVFEEGIAIPDESERFPPNENRYVSYRASHVGGASVIPPEELGEVQPEDEDDTSSIEQGVLPYPEKTEEPVVDKEEVEVKESDATEKSKTTASPQLDRTVLVSESVKTPSKSSKKGAKVKRSHTTGSSARSVPWDTAGSASKDSAPTVFTLNYATAAHHGREYLYRLSDYDNSPGESVPKQAVTTTKISEVKGKDAEPRSKGETKFTEAIKPVESKKEANKATESAKTLDSVKAMEAQTSKAEAGSASEQAPPVPPKDVKKSTPTYTPTYLSGKPAAYKSELPSYLQTGKVTASISATPKSTTDTDAAKKGTEEKAKEADGKAVKEAEEKAKQEAEDKAAKEAEAKKAAEAKAAKEAEEKKVAEEKAAKEAEAKKAAEEKAAKEAEAKKAAEEKAAKVAEEKAKKEAEAKQAAEKAAKEADEKKAAEKAKKEAEEKTKKEAEAKAAKEAESKLSTKPSSKTLSSSASFSIPTSDRSKPAPAIIGIDNLYGLQSATYESKKPTADEAKPKSDVKVTSSRGVSSGAAPALAHASIYGKKGESKADTKEGKTINSVVPEFIRQNSFDTSVSTRAIPPESRRNSDASAGASLADSSRPSGLAPPINDASVLGLAKSERAASVAQSEAKAATLSTGAVSKPAPAAAAATQPPKPSATESKPTPSRASVTHSIQSKPTPSTTAPAASASETKTAATSSAPTSEKPAPRIEESKPAQSKPTAAPAVDVDTPSNAKASPALKESVQASKETKPSLPEKDTKRGEAAKEDAEKKPAEGSKEAAAPTKPTEATKDVPKSTEAAAATKTESTKDEASKASESAAAKSTETKPAVTKDTEASKAAPEEEKSTRNSSILAAFRKKDKKKNKNKKK
ncbi:hypothetical protein MBRA1_001824 [Malassezia brasiliensis]|uniref:Uncharacterized protein n=1 Tax=Malassezia brasiliensis TaxID=1821822 RepID=A0AAF0INM4_9BASI|nr:hypothetical protein MBRA1_001824 [Malassezia brasiliensis]